MLDPTAFQNEMKAQRDAYARDLPRRLAIVRSLWAETEAGTDIALRSLGDEVHKLRGSAGMYGFSELSQTAGMLDVAVARFFASGDDLAAWHDQLDRLVAALTRSSEMPQEPLPDQPLPGSVLTDGDSPSPLAGSYHDQSLVLVVDDEKPVRDAIRFYLEQIGFRSISAADGAQAVEMAARHAPDVVLMDIRMPKMDGLQATQRIYENPRLRNIPIVFLTAEDSTDKVLRALSYSTEGYLVKPVDMDTIADKLTAVLANAA